MTDSLLLTPRAKGLGIAGHDFRGAPDELARTFAGFGVGHLDYWRSNRGDLSLDAYAGLLRDAGLDVYTVNIDTSRGRFGRLDLEPAALEAFDVALAEAVAFGAPYLQIYLAPPRPEDAADRVRLLAESLAPAAARAADAGVTIVIENNFDHRAEDPEHNNIARSPQALREVVEAVGSDRLRLAFDHVNFVLCDVDLAQAWAVMAPYVVNVHIKDCAVLAEPSEGEDRRVLRDGQRRYARSTAVGEGELPWATILADLGAEDFAGWFTLDPYCDPEDVVAWSTDSFHYLRGVAEQPEVSR
jgi:sugar phosphate isomerase/epimerase